MSKINVQINVLIKDRKNITKTMRVLLGFSTTGFAFFLSAACGDPVVCTVHDEVRQYSDCDAMADDMEKSDDSKTADETDILLQCLRDVCGYIVQVQP